MYKVKNVLIYLHINNTDTFSVKYPAKIYFGCNGEYSKDIEPIINCYSNGRPCPELETWKKNNKETNFEPCLGEDHKRKYPSAQCFEPRKPVPCITTGEKNFWDYEWGVSNTGCIDQSTNTVIYPNSNCKSYGNLAAGKIEASKNDECWGSWAENIPEKGLLESFQFCRKSNNCVLMKVKRVERKTNLPLVYTEDDINYPECRFL